ncbi:MAG: hypothetical protein OXC31_15260 [Spirochaetaceae bacterium]|nr:hypothetical protein [Spirochaetaceae bacterium]
MTPIELMQAVIRENVPKDIWKDSPLVQYRLLGNTNRGEVGEEFVRRYLAADGIKVGNGNRTSPTDMTIGRSRIEVKTASLGANGTFQFNHIRHDKQYDYLICLGICPHDIVFNVWRKGEIAEEVAGHLVRMAEGQAITHKLTKKLADMLPIDALLTWATDRQEDHG